MSLEIKQLPKSEVEITGEISAEEFSSFWPKAIKELSKNVSIPGFRPGKIPEKILIEKVGEGAVLEKAANMALQNIYPKILQEKKIEAIGSPIATITKIARGSSLGFKFKTAILPGIKLVEDYKEIAEKIARKKEEVKIEEKEVSDSIEYIKKMKDKHPDKETPEINDELRENIRKNLQAEKEHKQKEKKRLEILGAILKKSDFAARYLRD